MVSSRIRSCFITAPAGTNLDVLTDALRRRDIRVVGPEAVSLGATWETEISNLLTSADLVIGVLTRARRSDWVLFELGQAWGQGKMVLLFAPPDSAHVPSTLRRFLTVRANLSNREAIEFALDQILAVPEPTSMPSRSVKEKPPLGASADRYLQGSVPMFASVNALELEALVANALREAGVDVLARSQAEDRGADLAIWSDELQPFVGNPLLVEIKSRLATPKASANAAQQLSRYVASTGGLWGLLLYGVGPADLGSLPPNILALSIETLFLRLRGESFDQIVRDLRNRRVHGIGL
ncbi:MAG: hypothetical protein IBJ15_15785 [Alphaproteobacteria bacterium]|nr:hypothetical protein [Alphaproteobacteria bacterium]